MPGPLPEAENLYDIAGRHRTLLSGKLSRFVQNEMKLTMSPVNMSLRFSSLLSLLCSTNSLCWLVGACIPPGHPYCGADCEWNLPVFPECGEDCGVDCGLDWFESPGRDEG